jgi:uncharacterized membrane protein
MAVGPNFISYILSFIYVAIYWNNHHHLLHTVTKFSPIHAVAAGIRDNQNNRNELAQRIRPSTRVIPTAFYGGLMLMPAIAYYLLQKAILRKQGSESVLANALGADIKGKISLVLYAAAVILAFVSSWISIAIYVLVAVMWLVPDRRIENAFREKGQ